MSCRDQQTSLAERAQEIAQNTLIIDGHIDLSYRLTTKYEDVSKRAQEGDFDYVRAGIGGLNAPFMVAYVPADLGDGAESTAYAHEQIDLIEQVATEAPDKFSSVRSPGELKEVVASGRVAFPMGLENGSPLAGDLKNLQAFYDRGIRYITLVHSKTNTIADSSFDAQRQWNGLSPFGYEVVERMNQLGIMIDVSHLSDDSFWEVLRVSKAPPLATHSSARHFTPGFERNMSDKMIKALAKRGGIIMINFGSVFLTQVANEYRTAFEAAYARDGGDRQAYIDAYVAKQPFPYATVEDVLDHIDHVVQLAGIDAVGLGSDFDGVGDTLPTGLKDASEYPNLIEGLLRRGYSEIDIAKILGENLLRVWFQVEAFATAAD